MLHYMMASAEGDIFSVETRPDDFDVIQPTNDVLVHTNHYISQKMKVGDVTVSDVRGSSFVRLQRLSRHINRIHGDVTAERMMEFMSDHGNYPTAISGHPNEEVPPGARSMTVASIIMVPAQKTMYVSFGAPCEYEYIEYKL